MPTGPATGPRGSEVVQEVLADLKKSPCTKSTGSSDERKYENWESRNPDGRVEARSGVAQLGVAKASRFTILHPVKFEILTFQMYRKYMQKNITILHPAKF